MMSVCLSVSLLLLVITGDNLVSANDYGKTLATPGKSCLDIYLNNPTTHGNSGTYIINTNRFHFVHCDMKMECGGEKGWMKVADVNPTGGDDCPNGWKNITSPKACRAPSDSDGCYSTHFSTHKVHYSRVCGMVVGYQKGTTDAFESHERPASSINGPYLDGVSITYGTPRKHIWSYASGWSDTAGVTGNCPCATRPGTPAPTFIQYNYYCESGAIAAPTSHATIFTSNPLWDGAGCSSTNSCCARPNLPWFYRQIPLTSDKDLEARICRDEVYSNEGVFVKQLKLYVQ